MLAVSERGAVYRTTVGGESWRAEEGVEMNKDDLVASAWWRSEGGTLVVLGRKNTFKSTSDWTEPWDNPDPTPEWIKESWEGDWIMYARFSGDGSTGVMARQSGWVHVLTRDKGWLDLGELIEPYAPLSWYGEPVAAAFSTSGERGVLGGPHFLRVTEDGGQSWDAPKGDGLEELRGWAVVALAEEAANGVLLGTEGSVFVTSDYGKLVEPKRFPGTRQRRNAYRRAHGHLQCRRDARRGCR